MSKIGRFFGAVGEVCYIFAKTCSGILNRWRYKGSIHQSLSARTHAEAHDTDSPCQRQWQDREARIDALFLRLERPWGRLFGTAYGNHCRRAWNAEIERAELAIALSKRVGHSHDE